MVQCGAVIYPALQNPPDRSVHTLLIFDHGTCLVIQNVCLQKF
jgi:hypothetical protein